MRKESDNRVKTIVQAYINTGEKLINTRLNLFRIMPSTEFERISEGIVTVTVL